MRVARPCPGCQGRMTVGTAQTGMAERLQREDGGAVADRAARDMARNDDHRPRRVEPHAIPSRSTRAAEVGSTSQTRTGDKQHAERRGRSACPNIPPSRSWSASSAAIWSRARLAVRGRPPMCRRPPLPATTRSRMRRDSASLSLFLASPLVTESLDLQRA